MVNREIKARKRAVKEEKEEIDGEIVRIRKGHPRTNLPVKLPENPTWLKQPNVVTLMAGDFKTVQIRILIAASTIPKGNPPYEHINNQCIVHVISHHLPMQKVGLLSWSCCRKLW